MEETKKVNVTFETDIKGVEYIESFLRHYTMVIDFKFIPDTSTLYDTNETFRKLIAEKRKIQREIDLYINEYNFKTK